jgi:hypothetical protein
MLKQLAHPRSVRFKLALDWSVSAWTFSTHAPDAFHNRAWPVLDLSAEQRPGATWTCEGEPSSGETHFHVGAFDQGPRLKPTWHIFPEERLP